MVGLSQIPSTLDEGLQFVATAGKTIKIPMEVTDKVHAIHEATSGGIPIEHDTHDQHAQPHPFTISPSNTSETRGFISHDMPPVDFSSAGISMTDMVQQSKKDNASPGLRHPERSEGSPALGLVLNPEIPHYVRDDVDSTRKVPQWDIAKPSDALSDRYPRQGFFNQPSQQPHANLPLPETKTKETSFMQDLVSFFIPSAEASVREDRVREVKNFYVSNQSQTSDSGDLIGIVFYDHKGLREINVDGETIREGHIVFCSPESLDDSNLDDFPFHRQLFERVMGRNAKRTDFTVSGFSRQKGEWQGKSTSLNRRDGPNYTKRDETNHQPIDPRTDPRRVMSDYEFQEVVKATNEYLDLEEITTINSTN